MTATQPTSFTLAALTLNLQRLCIIRAIVLLFMSAAAVYAYFYLEITHQLIAVAVIIIAQFSLTTASYFNSRNKKTVTESVFALQLIADVVFIFALAYFTGGATNPFVSYFLVPLSIAAATLPWRHAALIALLAVAAYTLLLFFYQPLAFFSHSGLSDHSGHGNHVTDSSHAMHTMQQPTEIVFNAHYLGMWFNFLVSALLIAWFVSRMAEAIRGQQEAINQQREQRIYDEQILSIATLAAGTAHELGTPINSMSLLIDELELGTKAANPKAIDEDIALMKSQIGQCRSSLNKLVQTAQQTQPGEKSSVNIYQLVQSCIEHWHNLRPEVNVEQLWQANCPAIHINCDESLTQAITNLLNNAANAKSDWLSVDIQTSNTSVDIIIQDRGEGVPDFVIARFGKEPIPNKQPANGGGLGFGLFLSNASIQRHGGELLLRNRQQGGAEAIIKLPLPLPQIQPQTA